MQWIEDPKSKQRVAPDQDGQSFVTPTLQVIRPLPQNMEKTESCRQVLLATAKASKWALHRRHRHSRAQQSLPRRLRTVHGHIQRWTAWGTLRLPNLWKQFLGYSMRFESNLFSLQAPSLKSHASSYGCNPSSLHTSKLPATMEASQTILNHILCLVSGSKFVAAGFNWDCHVHREANTFPVARGDPRFCLFMEVAGSHLPGSKDLELRR